MPVADTFVFAEAERLALVGFLAGYRGTTRDAYRMDLRLFAAWCAQHDTALFEVQRVDIERYARQLEARGLARPRSRVGCQRSQGSTGTPSKKA